MGRTLGELEQLLLMALLQRDGEAAGLELRQVLADRTGRETLPGAVYTIMERLRGRGLVTAFTGEATPERGGRRRKHYRITPDGERALAKAYRQVEAMAEGIRERLRSLEVEP